jgi:hypothetical protein
MDTMFLESSITKYKLSSFSINPLGKINAATLASLPTHKSILPLFNHKHT